jgi:hypothetical protein
MLYLKGKFRIFRSSNITDKSSTDPPLLLEKCLLTENEPQYADAYCACEGQKTRKEPDFFIGLLAYI